MMIGSALKAWISNIVQGAFFSPYYKHPQHFGMESNCTCERSRGTHGRGPCDGNGHGTAGSEGKFFASAGFVLPSSVTMASDCDSCILRA